MLPTELFQKYYVDYLREYEKYPNYDEYADILDDFTYIELRVAFDAIHDHELADELFEIESPLLIFLIDSAIQEKLFLFFEDDAQMEGYRHETDSF